MSDTSKLDTSTEATRGAEALLRALSTQLMTNERLKMADMLSALSTQRDELLTALTKLRHICADTPAIVRNPRFMHANQMALAAIKKAGG